MSLPEEMKAVVYTTNTDVGVKSVPLPELRPTYLLIKVHSIALNPTDYKCVNWVPAAKPFSIVGCDYAGTVVSIGSEVTKTFKVGDKVFGCAHGSNTNEAYGGVFAEYAAVKGDVAMHAPENGELEMEDLATFSLCAITAGQGLFQPNKALGLSLPEDGKGNGEWVLIYGGSTACGTLGIQYAKLAGYKVITTCSPRNFELVRSRGADEVFDYNDKDWASKVRKLTDDKLKYCWDTVGEWDACNEALSTDSSIASYATIVWGKTGFPRKEVKSSTTLMYTMFGESFQKYGGDWPASKEDFEFGKLWMNLTEKLVAEGKLKPHPKRLEGGGLEGVLSGLNLLKEEKVSGGKLVYRISETP
jgi:NADPH:quinone reductase-like Zn-dependent oxidoreductase